MLSDLAKLEKVRELGNVLILVLVDYALWPKSMATVLRRIYVLILVLVDYALWPWDRTL